MYWFKNVCTLTTVGNIEIACGYTGRRRNYCRILDNGGWRRRSYLPKVNSSCFGGRGKHQEITWDTYISFKLSYFSIFNETHIPR
jgi:hypothetical protein